MMIMMKTTTTTTTTTAFVLVVFTILLAFEPVFSWIHHRPYSPCSTSVSTTQLQALASGGNSLPPKYGDNKELQHVFYQNQAWKASKLADDPNFFNKLGRTSTPEFMWIGCSESSIPPANVIMGIDAGNIFVHRNVANMVLPTTDTNLLSAISYAVTYLKVKHIIICGHYDCGGIKAATEDAATNTYDIGGIGPLELWLRNVRDVYVKNRVELDAIKDPMKRHRKLVDLNVIQQCVNVMKTNAVQKRRAETFKEGEPYTSPLVHAVVFDPKNGSLKRLEVDFTQFADELTNVYGLNLES